MTLANTAPATAARNAEFTDDARGRPSAIGRILAIAERSLVLVADPLHQERIAEEDRRKAERVRDAIRRRANEMVVPRDEDLRTIIEDDEAYATPALRAVRSALTWRGDRRCGLLLVLGGPTGVGKTAAACHALVRHDAGGVCVRADQICATPRTGYSAVEEQWEKWLKISMLVIDDAGTENSRSDLLRSLLRARYDAGLVTFVSTNLPRKRFAEVYLVDEHDRLADRLINAQRRGVGDKIGEGGLDWYVELSGESLRYIEARERLLKGSSR
jgi:DNA replication protein DnaC